MATSDDLQEMLTKIENGESLQGAFEVFANEGTFVIRIHIPTSTVDEDGEPVWDTIEQEIPKQMMQMAKMLGVF